MPGAYLIGLPTSSSVYGPSTPYDGMVRFNPTDSPHGAVEYYQGGQWRKMATEGTVSIVKDTFTGNGLTTTFNPMTYAYNPGQELEVLVFVGNVFQNPGVAYTFDGSNNINFTSPPPNGQTVVILHNFASTVV